MKKIVCTILLMVITLSLFGCGDTAGKKGTEYGTFVETTAMGYASITLKKDGTYEYYHKSNNEGDDASIEQGTYKKDDDGILYFQSNTEIEGLSFGDYLTYLKLSYDTSLDALKNNAGLIEIFYRSDEKDLQNKKEMTSRVEQQNTSDVSKQNETQEIQNESNDTPQPQIVDDGIDDALKALNNYMGNPVENEIATWNDFKVAAYDSENTYWEWSFGGGYGILQQNNYNPARISEDNGSTLVSKFDIIRLIYHCNGEPFSFNDIQYAGNVEFEYDNQALSGEKWILIDEENQSAELDFAYYIPERCQEYIDQGDDPNWYQELTMFVGNQPIAAFDFEEFYPYSY